MTFYLVFVFLAIDNAGCMTTLQLQHLEFQNATMPQCGHASESS